MGPLCSSAETQVCHRSYIIAARMEQPTREGRQPDIWQNQAHFANLHTTAILNQNGRHRSTKQ
jgi:hypothetical protein